VNDSTCDDFDPEYADGYELHFYQVTSAEQPRKCIECNGTIAPGADHEQVNARYEGVWAEYHTCLPCMRVRDNLMSCGWVYGRMWEDIAEAWCEQLPPMDDEEYDKACDEINEVLG
jgi:hypothetical protein